MRRLRCGVLIGAGVATSAGLSELLGISLLAHWPLGVALAMNASAFATAWRLTGLLSDDQRSMSRIIESFVVMLVLIVVVETVLGTLGWLRLGSVMAATGLIALGVWGLGRQSYVRPPCEGAPTGRFIRAGWVEGLLVGLVAFAAAQVAWAKWLTPPLDDALRYHLPYAVEWIQHHDLRMPIPPAGDPYTPFGPLNASLWMMWLMVPFEGDILVRFVQVPFAALMALAATLLARDLEFPEATAWVVGVLVVSLPDVMRQAFVVGNDVILSALLMVAIVSLVQLWRHPTVWRLVLSAAVLGLALGTKMPALPYVGILFLIHTAAVARGWKATGWANVVMLWLLAAGVVTALGGYAYVRNLGVQGNPFYPVKIALGNREIAPGLFAVTSTWKRLHPYYPFDWWALLFDSRVEFGWTIPVWIVPGVILSLPRLVTERRYDLLAILAWIATALGLFWFVVPYHFSRFLYAHIAWAIALAAWGWQGVVKGRGPSLALLALPLVAVNAVSVPKYAPAWQSPAYWLAGGTIMALAARAVVQARKRATGPGIRSRPMLVLASIVFVAVIVAWPAYAELYRRRRFDAWGRHGAFLGTQPAAWAWIAAETRGDPAVIVPVGTNVTYPLYGPELSNDVFRVTRDGRASDYGWRQPYHGTRQPDRTAWLAALDEERVDFLYATPQIVAGGWPLEDAWAASMPDRFASVFANEDVHIWRVLSGG